MEEEDENHFTDGRSETSVEQTSSSLAGKKRDARALEFQIPNFSFNVNSLFPNNTKNDQNQDGFTAVKKAKRGKKPDSNLNTTMANSSAVATHTPSSVHSYFTFGVPNKQTTMPLPSKPSTRTFHNSKFNNKTSRPQFDTKNRNPNSSQKCLFPPIKIKFENTVKPSEPKVLNEIIKFNTRLNINFIRYSTLPNHANELLIFANNADTYQQLLTDGSLPKQISGSSFTITLPNRIPTCQSIIMTGVPATWDTTEMHELLAVRYQSVAQTTRIYNNNGESTTRVRVDLRQYSEVERILKDQHIYMNSVSCPAKPYSPLLHLQRCFQCQQFGHTSSTCTNSHKCFKCAGDHSYNKDCKKPIKCANCGAAHMAGSPQCQHKINHRKSLLAEKQTQHSHFSPVAATSYATKPNLWFSSPATLFSSVLTATAKVNETAASVAKAKQGSQPQSSSKDDSNFQTTTIINSIQEAIHKSQTILMDKITKVEFTQELTLGVQHDLQMQINQTVSPQIQTLTTLLTSVCEKLGKANLVSIEEEQNTLKQLVQQQSIVKTYSITNTPQAQELSALNQSTTPSQLSLAFNPRIQSIEMHTHNTTTQDFIPSTSDDNSHYKEEEERLISYLETCHQQQTCTNIFNEWSTATTLSSLIDQWDKTNITSQTRPPNMPFSLLLYNVSSLLLHLEDIIHYIGTYYPTVFVLNGLHFDNKANYQLSSFFKSRYTIYFQNGTVHLNSKKYTICTNYSPNAERLPIETFNEIYRYNKNLILCGDFNSRNKERCTSYHRTSKYRPSLPPYLIQALKHRRNIVHLYQSIKSPDTKQLLQQMNRFIKHEVKMIKRAQWQKFCLALEPKNTYKFWNCTKRLFRKRTPPIKGFLTDNQQIITEANTMVNHAHKHYSNSFKRHADDDIEISTFYQNLHQEVDDLPSKPFLFKMPDLVQSIQT
ncbi:unnamed protein product, partial [Didymodactylos carnosus]